METTIFTPRLPAIPLPQETYPFNLRATLAFSSSTCISLDLASPHPYVQSLTADEASRPATSPPTPKIRVVHPSLDGAIEIYPSNPHSNVVTVHDLLRGLQTALFTPISFDRVPSMSKTDILSYLQSKNQQTLRRIDLLEGATVFRGLMMDVAQSNRILGTIDQWQSVTWILNTIDGYIGFAAPTPTRPYGANPAHKGSSYRYETPSPPTPTMSYVSAPVYNYPGSPLQRGGTIIPADYDRYLPIGYASHSVMPGQKLPNYPGSPFAGGVPLPNW